MSYVLATIQLPIEMFENGHYEIYSDRVSIQLHPCDTLPEKNEYNNQDLLEQIFSMSKKKEKEDEKVYLKKSRPKKRENLTFSNRPKSHRYTKHNYPSLNTSTADSRLSLSDLD
jgi:hypothetical protein